MDEFTGTRIEARGTWHGEEEEKERKGRPIERERRRMMRRERLKSLDYIGKSLWGKDSLATGLESSGLRIKYGREGLRDVRRC